MSIIRNEHLQFSNRLCYPKKAEIIRTLKKIIRIQQHHCCLLYLKASDYVLMVKLRQVIAVLGRKHYIFYKIVSYPIDSEEIIPYQETVPLNLLKVA